jgi:hypothetical protein
MDGAHGAAHACCGAAVVYGVRRMRREWRVLCMLHHHVASMRVASVHLRALHRCIGARCISLCCIGLCCMLQPRSRPAAHGRASRCVVSGARALLDRAKAGLFFWLPSGGAMRSCAVRKRRRALHDRGHRAVRRRGDIRHRSRGACTASAAMRSWGGCRRTGCNGRLQWAWPRRLVRRATAAWCSWTMGP